MTRKEDVSINFVLPTPEQQAQFETLAEEFERRIDYGEQVTHIMSGPGEEIRKMGVAAIQPIVTRLSTGNPLWYMPLADIVRSLTGDIHIVKPEEVPYDPKAPRKAFTQFEGHKRAWLKWAKINGYKVELPPET